MRFTTCSTLGSAFSTFTIVTVALLSLIPAANASVQIAVTHPSPSEVIDAGASDTITWFYETADHLSPNTKLNIYLFDVSGKKYTLKKNALLKDNQAHIKYPSEVDTNSKFYINIQSQVGVSYSDLFKFRK